MASEDWMSEKFQQIFGDDTTIKESITGLSAVAATKTDLNSVKSSILGNGSNISLTSLNSALSTATNKIDTIDGKVATSSALSTGLTGINNNLNSVQSVLSGKIEDIEFPTDYAKAAALTQGFSEAAKQSTVGSILGAVAQVNQQGVITSSVIDVATNAKTAADDAKTAANSASSSASNALSAANDAKTASVAAKTAAESVSSAVIKNNKNVIDEILDSAHGLTAIQGLAASASSSSGIASGAAVNAANNTIDIKSELSNSTYGLSAVKTAINAIPTTAPATPANVTNAKVEIIDTINNLKSLLPEAVSMGINDAILKTLRVTSQEWELLLHGEPVRIDGDFVKNFSESYPYVICRDDREPRYRFIIKIEQQ